MADNGRCSLEAVVTGPAAEEVGEAKEQAIGHLLEFAAPAYRLAENILRSPQAAEDAVQQAYLEAITRIRSSSPPVEPRPWFLRVVALTAKHARRSEANLKRREAAVEPKAEDIA
jgi:DNA-directed RNA polymerase specialized sigma24 family protein